MFELNKTEEINRLISITKSDSGVSGPKLARVHIALGEALGKQMTDFDSKDTTIIAMLRGGIFFAEGIYFALGCKLQMYDPKHEEFVKPRTKNVILVDSVINTGKTIYEIFDKDMAVACCVINEKAVPMFEDKLYAVRISKNSYVGSDIQKQSGNRGPDTTMRLFNLL